MSVIFCTCHVRVIVSVSEVMVVKIGLEHRKVS